MIDFSYLSTNGFCEDFKTLDLRIIKYLLNQHDNLFINEYQNGEIFYHLSEDYYNEFSMELREEYFKN